MGCYKGRSAITFYIMKAFDNRTFKVRTLVLKFLVG